MIYSQSSVVYKKYLKILSYKERLRAAVVRGVACKANQMARDWNAEIERHAKTWEGYENDKAEIYMQMHDMRQRLDAQKWRNFVYGGGAQAYGPSCSYACRL